MAAKNISFDMDAREAIRRGVQRLAQAAQQGGGAKRSERAGRQCQKIAPGFLALRRRLVAFRRGVCHYPTLQSLRPNEPENHHIARIFRAGYAT